jgi:hypothetical protein
VNDATFQSITIGMLLAFGALCCWFVLKPEYLASLYFFRFTYGSRTRMFFRVVAVAWAIGSIFSASQRWTAEIHVAVVTEVGLVLFALFGLITKLGRVRRLRRNATNPPLRRPL